MRAHTRAIAPALPLMYALRLLWAEPRMLFATHSVGRRKAGGFVAPDAACSKRLPTCPPQRRLGSQLLPWAHALPLDGPVVHRRRPRVRSGSRDRGTVGIAVSGANRQ